MPGPVLRYGPDDLPAVLPVFPLNGVILLPRVRLPLNVFEPRYLAMVDDAMANHRLIGMIQPDAAPEHTAPPLRPVGCAGRITSLSETGDGRYLISLSGIIRFRVAGELAATTPYRQIRPLFDPFADDLAATRAGATPETTIDRPRLLSALNRYLDANNMKPGGPDLEAADPETLINSLCMICPFEPSEKQALLEAQNLRDRAGVLTTLIEMATAASFGGSPAPLQ